MNDSSQQPPVTPINLAGILPASSQWTQKQKSRRIVLQPQSRLVPSWGAPTSKGNAAKASAQNSRSLFKSQEGAPLLQAHKLQQLSTSEAKPTSLYSKSQSAVKRQRSALWLAKAHALSMNQNNNQATKKTAANHNQSVQVGQKDLLSSTHCFTSPVGAKTQMRTQHQQAARQRHAQNGSPGLIVTYKGKKQSLHTARLTVQKFLKKRVGEQIAIFAKVGVHVPNSHYAIPTVKVAEVFSNIAKNTNNRASSHLEIANMFRASTSQAMDKLGPKKKKPAGPSAKQILSSIGLHPHPSQPVAVASNLTVNGKSGHNSNIVFNFASGKAIQQFGKHQRRASQSRLENFEQPLASALTKKTYNLPVHKLKKRLKQHLANHSLQSLKESLFNQNPREPQTAARQGRAKNLFSRSKSKSPFKKTSSRISNKARPLTKRSYNRAKKPTGDLEEAGSTSFQGATDLNAFSSVDTSKVQLDDGSKFADANMKQLDKNLNPQTVTANEKDSAATKIQNEVLNKANVASSAGAIDALSIQKQSDVFSSQQEKSFEEESDSEDEQSVADEVLENEAAEAVLRELTKICAIQAAHGYDGDDQDAISKLSHRSHDNIGYVASPLLECNSLQESEEGGRKAYSERELQQQEDESSEGQCIDDFIGESEEGIPYGAALIGQKQEQEQLASPVLGTPSEERLFVVHSRKQLEFPALKAHALAHLGDSKATDSSGQAAVLGAQQTATHKKGLSPRDIDTENQLLNTRNQQLPLQSRNKDVTEEWVQPEADSGSNDGDENNLHQDYDFADDMEEDCNEDEVERPTAQAKFGQRFPTVQSMRKPKSPSNLSIESGEEREVSPVAGIAFANQEPAGGYCE